MDNNSVKRSLLVLFLLVSGLFNSGCDRWILDRYNLTPNTTLADTNWSDSIALRLQSTISGELSRLGFTETECKWQKPTTKDFCRSYFGKFELCGLQCSDHGFSVAFSVQKGGHVASLRFYHGRALWRHGPAVEIQDSVLVALTRDFPDLKIQQMGDLGTAPQYGTSNEWWLSQQ